jgi:hypothetical protein
VFSTVLQKFTQIMGYHKKGGEKGEEKREEKKRGKHRFTNLCKFSFTSLKDMYLGQFLFLVEYLLGPPR